MNYKQLMWEYHHYRFGLAGEGQADIIQGYLERDRGQVLNIGCGPSGDKIDAMAPHCNSLFAADLHCPASARSEGASDNVAFLNADAGNLPITDTSIDHIVALGLFVWIENPANVLSEFYRVCRTGGLVMLTNAVRHPIDKYIELSTNAGFRLIEKHSGYCPAASGTVKERYLLVLAKR